MVVFGGTDEAIEDQRRGLFSYEALRTRLTPNPFASGGRRDLSAPVLKLAPLRPEDLYVLLHNIRDVHAFGDASKHALSDAGLEAFVKWSARNLGDASYRTPRETVVKFVGLLSLIDADPALDWPSAFTQVGEVAVPKSPSAEADDAVVPEGDDLSTFKL